MSNDESELGERQKRALKIAASFSGRFFRKIVWYGIRLFLYQGNLGEGPDLTLTSYEDKSYQNWELNHLE